MGFGGNSWAAMVRLCDRQARRTDRRSGILLQQEEVEKREEDAKVDISQKRALCLRLVICLFTWAA